MKYLVGVAENGIMRTTIVDEVLFNRSRCIYSLQKLENQFLAVF